MATTQTAGWFGEFGGQFVPETLIAALKQLEHAWNDAVVDQNFYEELDGLLEHYVARPTPLTFAPRLTERIGGASIWLKREDFALRTSSVKP